MSSGRPTKYNADMLAKARDYIEKHEDYGDPVPIAAGLAVVLDVSKGTLYEWAKHHAAFSDTLDRLNQQQERLLSGGGLSNRFQPTITKLMLANHGYHERQEIEHSGQVQVVVSDKGFGKL